VDNVNVVPFLAVLADDVTDVSGWEQLALSLRYFKHNKAEEMWIKFIACSSAKVVASMMRYGMPSSSLVSMEHVFETRPMMVLVQCQAILTVTRRISETMYPGHSTITVAVTN
jgi:hypothetical protein